MSNDTEYTPGPLILHPDGSLTSPPGPDRPAHVPSIPIGILPFHRFRPNLERAVQCWNACTPLGKDPAAVLQQARNALVAMLDPYHVCGVDCDKNKLCPVGEQARAALRALGD